jgi:hypothetical protein
VKVFHRFVDYPSSGRNKSGSPGCVFGVVVTAGYESLPKGVVVVVGGVRCVRTGEGWELDWCGCDVCGNLSPLPLPTVLYR